jgi:hypothetical protein
MHGSNRTLAIGVALFLSSAAAHGQNTLRVALKNGESVDIGPVYFITNCKSIVIGRPDVEILEGPPEVTVSIREEMVLPRLQNCAQKVPGGTVVLTAKDLTASKEAKITYRVKYKTKDGDRQRGVVVNVSLFP